MQTAFHIVFYLDVEIFTIARKQPRVSKIKLVFGAKKIDQSFSQMSYLQPQSHTATTLIKRSLTYHCSQDNTVIRILKIIIIMRIGHRTNHIKKR